MINRPLLKKSRRPVPVSSLSHIYIPNIANIARFPVSGATEEEKIEKPASEPAGAEKDETSSGNVAANGDDANKESPKSEGDTEAPPAAVEATLDNIESTSKATEEGAISENPSPNEDSKPKDAESPPTDPAAGSDAPVAEEVDTGDTVSSFLWCC